MKILPCKQEVTYADLVEDIVCQLVDKPDCVTVCEMSDLAIWLRLRIEVSTGDKGKVIGRHGAVVNSIRMLLSAMSHGNSIKLDVEEA